MQLQQPGSSRPSGFLLTSLLSVALGTRAFGSSLHSKPSSALLGSLVQLQRGPGSDMKVEAQLLACPEQPVARSIHLSEHPYLNIRSAKRILVAKVQFRIDWYTSESTLDLGFKSFCHRKADLEQWQEP